MKLVLSSRNPKKIAELRALLSAIGDVEVLSTDDIGLVEDVVEDGNTFHENAYKKAYAGLVRGYITVADDSGLMVDALGGAPGIYSARYAGPDANDEKNNRKLLDALSGIPAEKRTARFVCSICCLFPSGKQIAVERSVEGVILTEPSGKDGFGYDPLFYIPGEGKTFAELPPERKNKISHRGLAMREFAEQFAREMKNNADK